MELSKKAMDVESQLRDWKSNSVLCRVHSRMVGKGTREDPIRPEITDQYRGRMKVRASLASDNEECVLLIEAMPNVIAELEKSDQYGRSLVK